MNNFIKEYIVSPTTNIIKYILFLMIYIGFIILENIHIMLITKYRIEKLRSHYEYKGKRKAKTKLSLNFEHKIKTQFDIESKTIIESLVKLVLLPFILIILLKIF